MKLTREQRQHLRERINAAAEQKKKDIKALSWSDETPEPKHVQKLRKLVDRLQARLCDWDKKGKKWRDAENDQRYKRRIEISNEARQLQETVLFGDAQKALAAVKAFERSK